MERFEHCCLFRAIPTLAIRFLCAIAESFLCITHHEWGLVDTIIVGKVHAEKQTHDDTETIS